MRPVVLSLALGMALLSVSVLGLTTSAQPSSQKPERKPTKPVKIDDVARFKKLIRHSVDFFVLHAWDEKSGSFYSNINNDGTRKNDVRHIVASSRMLYGLAHAMRVDADKYKPFAVRLKDYLLRAMTAKEDKVGPYFRVAINDAGMDVNKLEHLQIHHQAYGLCGLVALYSIAPTTAALEEIDTLYAALRERFKDKNGTGFFDRYTLSVDGKPGAANATKSFNSTVYVATAFLFELHDAVHRVQASQNIDAKHRELARKVYNTAAADLAELADATAKRLAAADGTGFIVEFFNADWKPEWPDDRKVGTDTIGILGHNFQAAWFLLRASQMPSASKEWQMTYKAKAAEILTSMLGKTAKDGKSPVDFENGGFHNGFLRTSGKLHQWGEDKHWWQQAEGILALTLAEKLKVETKPNAFEVRDKALQFFVDHFIDDENDVEKDNRSNGEFKVVTREGQPVKTEPKGEAGKSAYHTVELYRSLIEYAGMR